LNYVDVHPRPISQSLELDTIPYSAQPRRIRWFDPDLDSSVEVCSVCQKRQQSMVKKLGHMLVNEMHPYFCCCSTTNSKNIKPFDFYDFLTEDSVFANRGAHRGSYLLSREERDVERKQASNSSLGS
jgi:hypothetical protein